MSQKPLLRIRVLNHCDNLDRSVERGYAGRLLWDWEALPERVDPRLRDYARANASIGINGSVLNNVNANSQSLTAEYLQKTKAVAQVSARGRLGARGARGVGFARRLHRPRAARRREAKA